MFCTACATLNAVAAANCTNCGARLAPAPTAPAGEAARVSRHRNGRPWRTAFRRGLYLLPILAVLLATTLYLDGARARQRAAAAAYERGAAAEAAGDYLEAIDAYEAAAGYRDAPARRAAVVDRLAPYRDAYFAGVTALEDGRYDDAIATLLPVVRDVPTYEDAAYLLERARSERQDELLRTVDQATEVADWLTVERSLVSLVAENPSDEDLAGQLAEVRRDHAPLVFARDGDLYLIGPDGGDERLVTAAVFAAWPMWSPDRSRIAFVSTEGAAGNDGGSLYVVNGDGSELTEVATAVRTDTAPAWSPDGGRIAFVGGSEVFGESSLSTRSIRYVDLATGVVTDVTNGLIVNPASPTWSPAGDRLAFISRITGDQFAADPRYPLGGVYVANLATGEIAPVAPDKLSGARRVAWSTSHDALLVFSRAGGSTTANESISVVDLRTGALPYVFGTSHDASTPVWSPDGNSFAYVVDGSTLHIETFGGRSRTIDLRAAGGRSLTWAPDGQAVIVLGSWSGSTSVVIPLGDGVGTPTRLEIDFDTNRRFSGAPQWAPLAPATPVGPPTVAGTAGDPAPAAGA